MKRNGEEDDDDDNNRVSRQNKIKCENFITIMNFISHIKGAACLPAECPECAAVVAVGFGLRWMM